MISFLNPDALIYVYIVLAIYSIVFIYLAFRRKRFMKLIGLKDSLHWYLIQFIKLTALILIVLALSTPVSIHLREKYFFVEEIGSEFKNVLENLTVLHVLIVDESLSMLYTDGNNNSRINYAIDFIEKYLKHVSLNDLVMITGFAENSEIKCIGRSSYCLEKLSSIRAGRNYTDIAGAIDFAKTYADASQYPSVFVIISDGVHNKGKDPFEKIISVKEYYPVLFVRIGLDPRANNFVFRIQESGVRSVSMNVYTNQTVLQQLPIIIDELRLESFIAKKILRIKTMYEEYEPYPILFLLLTSCVLIIISRIEGF
uniref:VWA domain-containing protein n=1 Tax=Staphylothermus marinus TaxID=2280 RepID=A0A7C4D9B4_STAMA